jgi:hypothetical protein
MDSKKPKLFKKYNDKPKFIKKEKTLEEIEVLKLESCKITKDFKDFYRNNLEMSTEDFDDFIKCNETDLPIVFRVNQMK